MDLLDISGAKVLRHPLTGDPITPLIDPESGRPWRDKHDRLRWPIMGGAEDDDDDDAEDEDKDDKSKDSDEDEDSKSDEDDDDTEDDSGDSDQVDRAELDRVKKRMRAADQRADKAEKALKEREDADKSEVDKATDEAAELKKTNERLTSEVAALKMQVAFLTANRHVWHDPETALDIARNKGFLDDVVDEDGDVDKRALRKALDRLAKEQKYLVKSSKNGSSGDDEDDKSGGGSSGTRTGGRKTEKDKATRKRELQKRFTALR